MATNRESLDLPTLVKSAIDEKIREISEEEYSKAVERIKERQPEAVASVVLAVAEFVDYQKIGTELRISVKKD